MARNHPQRFLLNILVSLICCVGVKRFNVERMNTRQSRSCVLHIFQSSAFLILPIFFLLHLKQLKYKVEEIME